MVSLVTAVVSLLTRLLLSRERLLQLLKSIFAVLDVKPWSNETDMQRCEEELRLFKFEGLEWGECMAIFISYYK